MPGKTLIFHPSLVEYDFKRAWTWDEMKKRDKRNITVDKLRFMLSMPQRPYGRPIYGQWLDHRGKIRFLAKIGNAYGEVKNFHGNLHEIGELGGLKIVTTEDVGNVDEE